ncbi:MAG: NADAR family protein [Bacteroidales bacterium]|nr:NADAR family protein [Bacteroidales bacterium]MCF8337565.1 NADAR family protein [Bacteroidales bacterium]
MTLSTREYKKNECITFKSTKEKNGALSNMAPGYPIVIDGQIIRTAEALYQSLRFPSHPDIQREIINYPSPLLAKKYGRRNIDKSRTDWKIHRFKIMKFCIELKLFQNMDKFSKVLLETNNFPIVEYTDKDKVWGATDEGDYYVGTNALGRLLMELRENLKSGNFNLTIPEIDDLIFLGKPISMDKIKSAPNST